MSSRILSNSIIRTQRIIGKSIARIHTQTPAAAMPALKEELVEASSNLQKFKIIKSASSPYFNTGNKKKSGL
jgi:hypothetical protein